MSRDFNKLARPFIAAQVLSLADLHAVALTAPRFNETDLERMLGLAFAVHAPRDGHSGVFLGEVEKDCTALAGAEPLAVASSEVADEMAGADDAANLIPALAWPAAASWHDRALSSPMVGDPADRTTPFVRQETRGGTLLLTRRMYSEQERVAASLADRARDAIGERERLVDLDGAIGKLFPEDPSGEAAQAVRLAASRRVAFIIGGPGTGKTFSITRLLAALLDQHKGERPLLIALAAPTGKAAARMREAIREATREDAEPALNINQPNRDVLQSLEAKTLHSLLGVRSGGMGGGVRHDKTNPLAADVVVVDEASMIDLTLMRYLVEAVRPSARLVLLGDRDQLASVEAGSVLSDVVGDGASGPLASHTQAFTRSRRFESAPDIATIAACLQSHQSGRSELPSDPDQRLNLAIDLFMGRVHADAERFPKSRITWAGAPGTSETEATSRLSEGQLDALASPYIAGFTKLGSEDPPFAGYASIIHRYKSDNGHWGSEIGQPEVQRKILDALDRYRILAVHRRGALGVEGLNRSIGERVRRFIHRDEKSTRYWVGRPLLITQNAYDLGLMNGDVGLVLPAARGLAAVFPHERAGEVRSIALSRLPSHETALALTVHKSQGSQFDKVALVLAGRSSSIQTRELVYTGVTRAKDQFVWLGEEAALRGALQNRVTRRSGLGELVREKMGGHNEMDGAPRGPLPRGADGAAAVVSTRGHLDERQELD
jgi:exodeoxyribonuclease V alpha subunit